MTTFIYQYLRLYICSDNHGFTQTPPDALTHLAPGWPFPLQLYFSLKEVKRCVIKKLTMEKKCRVLVSSLYLITVKSSGGCIDMKYQNISLKSVLLNSLHVGRLCVIFSVFY